METTISKAFFQPWSGANYRSGIKEQKILILGESHYHDCEDDDACRDEEKETNRAARHSELTRDVVAWWKDNPDRSPLSYGIPKLFEMEKKDFWEQVIFYNYLQEFAGLTARVRPKEELWTDERNAEAFQEVIDYYEPDKILVLGKKLWSYLPSDAPPLAKRPEPELRMPVSRDLRFYEESERICYWYYSKSGHKALAMPIMHPAAVYFSHTEWIQPVADWLNLDEFDPPRLGDKWLRPADLT